eukprot:6178953-Pleurochrysis_carterae.AAC.1
MPLDLICEGGDRGEACPVRQLSSEPADVANLLSRKGSSLAHAKPAEHLPAQQSLCPRSKGTAATARSSAPIRSCRI